MSSTEEMDVFLTTDSDEDDYPWGYRQVEVSHAHQLVSGFYHKYPRADVSYDFYRGRETYDKLDRTRVESNLQGLESRAIRADGKFPNVREL